MLNEYTFKWLPTSLQCFPALSMPICNSQYISRNSGFVNTGISELSLPSYGVWLDCCSLPVTLFDPDISVSQICKTPSVKNGVNNKFITIFSVMFSM